MGPVLLYGSADFPAVGQLGRDDDVILLPISACISAQKKEGSPRRTAFRHLAMILLIALAPAAVLAGVAASFKD